MQYSFVPKENDKGYVSNNLILPKRMVNAALFRSTLTIPFGEAQEFDKETGELLRTTTGNLLLWEESKNHLIVPREFIPKSHYSEFRFPFVDLRLKDSDFGSFEFRDTITFRDEEQREAFDALARNYSGTLNLSCGRGKTVLALKLIATLKIPAVVVVNTTALLEQWKEEVEKHLGLKQVGVVQGTTFDWKHPVTIAMIHTLSGRKDRWPWEFRRHFGVALFDEAHHVSAPLFVKSADLFLGRRYSLTATAKRLDGLERIYQYHLGRVIYTNLKQDLIPLTIFHRLKWTFDPCQKNLVTDSSGDVNLSKVRTFLGTLEWRNRLIAQNVLKDLEEGRKVLVLSHGVEHVEALKRLIESYGVGSVGSITGSTPQKDRMPILRTSNPVVGTFQLAREGLNRPELDTLYVTTPFSSPNDLQQSWGRIQRIHPEKKDPLVRVYEDMPLNCCVSSCRNLRNFLNKWSYPFRKRDINTEETWTLQRQ
jgi:superfamily II DNA or RNA helicase